MDLGEVEVSHYLGALDPEEMPGIALQALAAGYDGPALLAIARLDNPTTRDLGDPFDRALGEMERSPLPKEEAGLRVARNIARKIASVEMHFYKGAYPIWTKVWDERGRPDNLTAFVGLASLYEADPDRRPFHLAKIVARAQELADEREDS
ncbi:MAG: hypothetical protein M3Q49_05300 [Actinomycetota bacterium]|nr:hypothetical protein [Actinomycetota bacterium]